MTERSPSLVSTGRWDEPHRSNVLRFDGTGDHGDYSAPLPGSTGGPAMREDQRAASSPEWPVWARMSLGVGVLLTLMLLVMWGASLTIR